MKEKLLQTEKGNIFYLQSENWDAGAETIFFLHGLTADHSMFDEQTAYFKNEYNVLAWDAPGHGKSRPFEEFDFGDAAGYMKAILDEHAVTKVVLAGQSLGGYFAQAFIKRYPDRAKAFISIDSTPYGLEYYSKFDTWILKQIGRMADLYPFGWMKRAMAKQVSATQKAYDNMMRMLAPYTKSELCRLMGNAYAAFLKDNCDLRIPCPVLLILGEKDVTGKVAKYNKEWAEKTGYPLEIIKGAAHNANVDKPREVNDRIRDFLATLNNPRSGLFASFAFGKTSPLQS
jgi:pimeloyl-ACP methyl ester carboxylesterase